MCIIDFIISNSFLQKRRIYVNMLHRGEMSISTTGRMNIIITYLQLLVKGLYNIITVKLLLLGRLGQ